MKTVIVLVVLLLREDYTYRSVVTHNVYQDIKSCEERLNEIELDIRRDKDYEVSTGSQATLLLTNNNGFEVQHKQKKHRTIYDCLPSALNNN